MERKLGRRAERVLEVLRAGGRWEYRREFGWRGPKFHWRLVAASGTVVKGFGHHARHEIEHLLEREGAGKYANGRPYGNEIYRLKA